jgi:acyl carrier protein
LFAALAAVRPEKPVSLWTDPRNAPAAALYRKLGFTRDNLRASCYTIIPTPANYPERRRTMEKLLKVLGAIRDGVDFEAENQLVDDGILDSFDVIALAQDLNEEFGVEIGPELLEPENFNSAASMLRMLSELGADV